MPTPGQQLQSVEKMLAAIDLIPTNMQNDPLLNLKSQLEDTKKQLEFKKYDSHHGTEPFPDWHIDILRAQFKTIVNVPGLEASRLRYETSRTPTPPCTFYVKTHQRTVSAGSLVDVNVAVEDTELAQAASAMTLIKSRFIS